MSWIQEKTNHNNEYWFQRVEQLIGRNTVTPEGEVHGNTDVKWVHDLVIELESHLPYPNTGYDGNMAMAARLGYILVLWFTNIQLAKCLNSDRPTFARQLAYDALLDFRRSLFEAMTDMKLNIFALQSLDFPFSGESKSGDFV